MNRTFSKKTKAGGFCPKWKICPTERWFGSVNWSSRYCDLTVLDYFLQVYVRARAYGDKPKMVNAKKSVLNIFS